MSITYQVNGSITLHGVESAWLRSPRRVEADQVRRWSPVAVNRLTAAKMEAATFSALRALTGSNLSSLATNDMLNRNAAATYTSVILALVSGQHQGHLLTNVTIDFWVTTAGGFDSGFDSGFD